MEKAEQEFLEQLFCDMRRKLLQYAKLQLNGIPLAEDAVQEVFAIASMRIDALMQSENPKGWLVNTLKNVLHAAKRSAAKQSQIFAAAVNDEAIQEAADYDLSKTADRKWVDLFYSGLIPDDDFQLIKMIDLDGYTIHETPKFLSISDEACKKRIQRARSKFKKALEKMAG